jgi:hypothetical protein
MMRSLFGISLWRADDVKSRVRSFVLAVTYILATVAALEFDTMSRVF